MWIESGLLVFWRSLRKKYDVQFVSFEINIVFLNLIVSIFDSYPFVL